MINRQAHSGTCFNYQGKSAWKLEGSICARGLGCAVSGDGFSRPLWVVVILRMPLTLHNRQHYDL